MIGYDLLNYQYGQLYTYALQPWTQATKILKTQPYKVTSTTFIQY